MLRLERRTKSRGPLALPRLRASGVRGRGGGGGGAGPCAVRLGDKPISAREGGFSTKSPWTAWSKTPGIYCLPVLEARSLKTSWDLRPLKSAGAIPRPEPAPPGARLLGVFLRAGASLQPLPHGHRQSPLYVSVSTLPSPCNIRTPVTGRAHTNPV